MIKKIRNKLRNPNFSFILYIFRLKIFRLMADTNYLKIEFRIKMKKKLELEDPKTFNEKIQWLKLWDRRSEYTQLTDKYKVRKYIEEKIGTEYLIPLLGVYNYYDEIDFKTLPNQFVLKPNHTSGDIYICKDKSKIDYLVLKKQIKKWMKREYFWFHREWQYKNIKPRIICEKYLVDESGVELKDYKFMCFEGNVKCSYVCLNRNTDEGLNVDFYDNDWNVMPFQRQFHPNSGKLIAKPKQYEKMVEFSEILSKYIPFVRVDFYEADGQLYFGELTFHPGSGFEKFIPESYDYLLGSWIELPINDRSKENKDYAIINSR